MKKSVVRVGVVGLGTVGAEVVRVLKENRLLVRAACGGDVEVIRVADKDRARLRASGLPAAACHTEFGPLLQDPSIQIVAELIGGVGAARELVLGALNAGKHVVTANKALMARHWTELRSLAGSERRALGFEASVMTGVPVIRALQTGMAGNRIESLLAILNGTSNFVLTQMSRGLGLQEALAEARGRGLCEADASLDIDGHDAAQKLAILASIAWGRWLPPDQVHREGIGHIEQMDIQVAREEFEYVLRPLAVCKRHGAAVEARVHPTFIPIGHPLASVQEEYNALLINAVPCGSVALIGKGAGAGTAASGVVSDIIEIARALHRSIGEPPLVPSIPPAQNAETVAIDSVESKFYLRFTVPDRPGVLAFIAGCLGKHKVSIATCHQRGRSSTGAVPIVMVTHQARGGAVRQALAEIDASRRIVRRRTIAVRIEE